MPKPTTEKRREGVRQKGIISRRIVPGEHHQDTLHTAALDKDHRGTTSVFIDEQLQGELSHWNHHDRGLKSSGHISAQLPHQVPTTTSSLDQRGINKKRLCNETPHLVGGQCRHQHKALIQLMLAADQESQRPHDHPGRDGVEGLPFALVR